MDLLEKPQMGLGFKEADVTLLGPTHPWQFPKGMLGTQAGTSRRGKKKYGSLNLYIIHKRISFSKCFHTWSCTRFLADFSPAPTVLRQAARHRGKQYFDPALGQSLYPRQSHMPAPSKSSGAGSCLLCAVEGWAFSLPRFLLRCCCRALQCSLWTRDSCSACVCVIYCSAPAGSSPAAGFSTCDSGGIRYWTSSVLMATLSGWSHLLKCSKVLGKSRRKRRLHQTSLINYLMIISVTQTLPSHPPPISSYNCFSLLTWEERWYSSDSCASWQLRGIIYPLVGTLAIRSTEPPSNAEPLKAWWEQLRAYASVLSFFCSRLERREIVQGRKHSNKYQIISEAETWASWNLISAAVWDSVILTALSCLKHDLGV